MTVVKQTIDTSLCPNCKQTITVPKSTRSFICRHCDAIIKVIQKEHDVELKVVGKSVEDDPDYQAIEAQVTELRAELTDLHARYVAFMANDIGNIGGRSFLLGLAFVVAGAVIAIWNGGLGGAVGLVGLVVGVAGWLIHRSRKIAKMSAGAEMSRTMDKISAERDRLQRKAARLKTAV
jgi:hypothetical protein